VLDVTRNTHPDLGHEENKWMTQNAIRFSTMLLVVVLAAISGASIGLLPGESKAGEVGLGDYCGIVVPRNTDCANISGGQWSNGKFTLNAVAANNNNDEVCEHTYILGTGSTLSRRCGINSIGSATDLWCPYAEGKSMSGHAGNGATGSEAIVGLTGVQKERSCI
jgi:hypothetical protein